MVAKTMQKSFRFSPDIVALLRKMANASRRSQTNVVETALIETAHRWNISVEYKKGRWQ